MIWFSWAYWLLVTGRTLGPETRAFPLCSIQGGKIALDLCPKGKKPMHDKYSMWKINQILFTLISALEPKTRSSYLTEVVRWLFFKKRNGHEAYITFIFTEFMLLRYRIPAVSFLEINSFLRNIWITTLTQAEVVLCLLQLEDLHFSWRNCCWVVKLWIHKGNSVVSHCLVCSSSSLCGVLIWTGSQRYFCLELSSQLGTSRRT